MAVWIRIHLSEEDKATLTMWANSGRTEQRLAKRAKVILLSDEGMTLLEISERTGLTRKVCSKWRKRFFPKKVWQGFPICRGVADPKFMVLKAV